MKVVLYTFTGGNSDFSSEYTSSVHTTLAGAEAAEVEWLEGNEDPDDEYPWFGSVEKIEVDITEAEIIR